MGISIWLMPSILIALTVKYQKELVYGIGYIPVYIEYFGVGLICSCILTKITSMSQERNIKLLFKLISSVIFLVFIICIVSITQQNANTYQEFSMLYINGYTNKTVSTSIRNEILDYLEESDYLIPIKTPGADGT